MVVKDTPIFVRVFKCRLLYFNDFSFSLKNEIRSFPQFLIFFNSCAFNHVWPNHKISAVQSPSGQRFNQTTVKPKPIREVLETREIFLDCLNFEKKFRENFVNFFEVFKMQQS